MHKAFSDLSNIIPNLLHFTFISHKKLNNFFSPFQESTSVRNDVIADRVDRVWRWLSRSVGAEQSKSYDLFILIVSLLKVQLISIVSF